jgi:hypothetical protein
MGFQNLCKLPLTLCGYNQEALASAKTQKISPRTKHIPIRDMFVREAVTEDLFTVKWIPTENMPADILIKPLTKILFFKFRDQLFLTDS